MHGLWDSKGFADIELEFREYISPDAVDVKMSLEETASFPLLFFFDLFGLISDARSTIFSWDICAPPLSTIYRLVRASKRFFVVTGAGDNEWKPPMGLILRRPGGVLGAPPTAEGQDGVL